MTLFDGLTVLFAPLSFWDYPWRDKTVHESEEEGGVARAGADFPSSSDMKTRSGEPT
jgi:hypothetical protein